VLARRVEILRGSRESGASWSDLLQSEAGNGFMQLVSELLGGMSEASGTLRKSVVDELRRENVSIPRIAKLLGVTHQRVSNLLRRLSPESERAVPDLDDAGGIRPGTAGERP